MFLSLPGHSAKPPLNNLYVQPRQQGTSTLKQEAQWQEEILTCVALTSLWTA